MNHLSDYVILLYSFIQPIYQSINHVAIHLSSFFPSFIYRSSIFLQSFCHRLIYHGCCVMFPSSFLYYISFINSSSSTHLSSIHLSSIQLSSIYLSFFYVSTCEQGRKMPVPVRSIRS